MRQHEELDVGSVVRAPRSESGDGGRQRSFRCTGQATILTVEHSENAEFTIYCVLMHDSSPRLLLENQSSFVICPTFDDPHQDEEERAVSSVNIQSLLEFEFEAVKVSPSGTHETFKQRGDTLFQLGDFTMAASWYEASLMASSTLSVGGVVAAKLPETKSIRMYEVDCVEEDSVDAVSCRTNDEVTIPRSQILLSLISDTDNIQERILLNLSRCMMQLAGLTDKSAQNRPYEYRKAAAWACTLVLEMLLYKKQRKLTTSQSLQENALLLRAKALAQLQKWKLARDSIRRLLLLHPNHKEGSLLERKMSKEQASQFKSNKKLAKEVCQWVDKASDTNKHSNEVRGESSSSPSPSKTTLRYCRDNNNSSTSKQLSNSNGPLVVLLGSLCFLALMSFWVQRHFRRDSQQDL